MSNTFKAGDKITLTARNSSPKSQIIQALIQAHTDATTFTLDTVGLATHNELEELLKQPSPEPDAVAFHCDECGKEFECNYLDVSLAVAVTGNPFKAGDKVTLNERTEFHHAIVTRDTTKGKVYTLIDTSNGTLPQEGAVAFIDDIGDTVTIEQYTVTLAE